MNGLLPIIRRVRRPLLPVEAPADAKPVAVPVKVKPEPVVDGQGERRKEMDGEDASAKPAE